MPTNRTQIVRLVLDYILDYAKVLMWPAIAAVVLIYLHTPLYNFAANVKTFNLGPVGATSGSTKSETQTITSPHADIWFSFQDVSALSSSACISLGKGALTTSSFESVTDNQNGIAYGYKDGYVGAVNCSLQKVAVITVAGPYDGLSNRHKTLNDAFASVVRGP